MVVCLYNGIVFSHKKESHCDTCYNVTNLKNMLNERNQDFPGHPVIKNPPANAGDTGLIPGLGRYCMQLSLWTKLLKPTGSRDCAP